MVEFTRPCDPSKPPLIHSTASRSAAVEDMVHTISKKEVRTIFQCAMIIRKATEQGKTWKFQGSLTDIYEGTPKELILLMKWIIQGDTAVHTGERTEAISRTSRILSQHIVQVHKSKWQISYKPKSNSAMFRTTTETPVTIGMSLHCYYNTWSKKLVDLVAHAGAGVSYQHTLECVNQIACAVQKTQMTTMVSIYHYVWWNTDRS